MKENSLKKYCVNAFTGEQSLGNQHFVIAVPAISPDILVSGQKFSRRVSSAIVVLVEHREASHRVARFFQNGREVKRCGSGSLSAAYVLVEKFDAKHRLTIKSVAGDIVVGKEGERYFYQTEILPYTAASKNSQWSLIVNRPIAQTVLVGDDHSYCIVELACEKAVRTCAINSSLLKRCSRRALIVTARSDKKTSDYVMRYFSPQYGRYEDPATGSANAMLANYWQERFKKSRIVGRQLSNEGGEFVVLRKGTQQRVLGRAQENTLSAELLHITDAYFREY